MKRLGNYSVRLKFGNKAFVAGGRGLAFSEPVNLIIVDKDFYINITSDGVNKVVSPLAVAVAVTSKN